MIGIPTREHGNEIEIAAYVGLPLAAAFGRKVNVLGFDIHAAKIQQLKDGYDATGELTSEDLAATTIDYTTDAARLAEASFFIVTVPTPIDVKKCGVNSLILNFDRHSHAGAGERDWRVKVAGWRPRPTLGSFVTPQKSQQKRAPDLLALRVPCATGKFDGSAKTRALALKQFVALIVKLASRSGCVPREGGSTSIKISFSPVGAGHRARPAFMFLDQCPE